MKVRVNVSQLRVGNEPWQKEEKTYRKGAIIEMPEEKVKSLGTAVTVITEPKSGVSAPVTPAPKPEEKPASVQESAKEPEITAEPAPTPEPVSPAPEVKAEGSGQSSKPGGNPNKNKPRR